MTRNSCFSNLPMECAWLYIVELPYRIGNEFSCANCVDA